MGLNTITLTAAGVEPRNADRDGDQAERGCSDYSNKRRRNGHHTSDIDDRDAGRDGRFHFIGDDRVQQDGDRQCGRNISYLVDEYGAIGNREWDGKLVGIGSIAGGFECGHDPGVRCGGKFGMEKRGGDASLMGFHLLLRSPPAEACAACSTRWHRL